jgi:hypothetical protein
MIVCTNCGNHNEDSDEFCGSCGKFLEWVGERIEAPAPAPEPVVEEEPEAVKVGFVDRVKAAVGIDEASRPVEAGVPVGVGGAGSLPAEPATAELDADAELQKAAEEAAAAEAARQEAEAAEAARRAAVAEEEARARAAAEAEALAAAAAAAQAAAEGKARAEAEAERMRQQQAEAEAKQREEAAARATAEAEAVAAEAAAQAAAEEQARAEAEADRMRQQQTEAEQQAQREATERATAEADRLRQEQAEKAAALEAAKRAEEAAKAAAEAEAKARAEAEQKARADAEAAKAAEDEARRRAEDEARARAAAEQRAREEEEARKRAAALLARPKAGAAPTPAEPIVDEPAASSPTSTASTAMTPAAAAAAAAAAAQRPTAQTPVAQQPTTVKQPPRPDPKVTAVEQAIKPGDLVCSQCGAGNDPARKFCRKCGNSLAQAVTAVKLPWWKRIFGGKKAGGGRVSKDATDKQRQRQKAKDASFKAQMALANVRKAVMVLMMLGLVGGLAIPSVRGEVMRRSKDGFGSVQDLFNPQVSPVNPIAVASTSAVAGKEANLAADLVVNSFWAEGAEGDGVGQTISFTFAEPTDLSKVLITGGSTDTPENYVNNPRPKALHLVFDTGGSADLNLIDAEFRKSQGFNLKGAKGVTKVDVVISSVYPGRGGTETGIAEVEFKKKG